MKLLAFLLVTRLHFIISFQDSCALKKSRCTGGSMKDCIPSEEEAAQEFGYEDLGCFTSQSPWTGILRPFPSPQPPAVINLQIYLYTRKQPSRLNVQLWPTVNMKISDFNGKRPATVFITHGFASNGDASWLSDMKDAYLSQVDANVFLVDWGKGASLMNYLQVASNTRIVGAEIGRLILKLVEKSGLNCTAVHLIGHSLGAQASAYAAKKVKCVGRLTALDPAQPGFEGTSSTVRIAAGDADFTDIIHTNARPSIPLCGLGMMMPVGDVDFYMNGGLDQPGCYTPCFKTNITSMSDLRDVAVESLSAWVSCSHGRAYEYFTSAINGECIFIGKQAGIIRRVANALTLGNIETVISKLSTCDPTTCVPIGLKTPLYKPKGSFAVTTTGAYPFCNVNEKITLPSY